MPEQKCDEPVMGIRCNKHLRKEKACCQDYDILKQVHRAAALCFGKTVGFFRNGHSCYGPET